MMAAVQVLHALASYVCIDLCSRHVAVAEQHLHDAQVRAVVSKWVANACRTVCGDSFFLTPALRA